MLRKSKYWKESIGANVTMKTKKTGGFRGGVQHVAIRQCQGNMGFVKTRKAKARIKKRNKSSILL